MNTAEPSLPDEQTVELIFHLHSPLQVDRVTRFPTGLCHHVYEIITKDGEAFVLRMARPETRKEMEGGCYWHPVLRDIGTPVPVLHASGLSCTPIHWSLVWAS